MIVAAKRNYTLNRFVYNVDYPLFLVVFLQW